jgi:hypothetical protein
MRDFPRRACFARLQLLNSRRQEKGAVSLDFLEILYLRSGTDLARQRYQSAT